MTTLTATEIKQLDKSNAAAQRGLLGTRIAADEVILTSLSASTVTDAANIVRLSASAVTAAGKYVTSGCLILTQAMITASAIVFSASTLGLTTIVGFIIQPWSSGSSMTSVKHTVSGSALTIIPGTYVPTLADRINYIFF